MVAKAVWSMNLIRNLAGLMIILSLLPIGMMAFRYTADIPFVYDEISDELALVQLREILLIAYDMNFQSHALSFRYKNRNFTLSKVNDKLILQPGTQIFLAEIDEMHFENRNGVIYVCYERQGKHNERVIASSAGFYLDDFSDCDVSDDLFDRIEE